MRRLVPGAAELIARSILRRDGAEWQLCCPGPLESRIYDGNMNLGLWQPLAAYDCPVMLICGDPEQPDSPPTSLAGQAFAETFGYPYEYVPDTDHFLELEAPADCERIMLSFLREAGFDV